MRVDLGLKARPLSGCTNYIDNLSLDRLDFTACIVRTRVRMVPDKQSGRRQLVTPCVAVVAARAICRPSQSEARAHSLFRHADVDWLGCASNRSANVSGPDLPVSYSAPRNRRARRTR